MAYSRTKGTVCASTGFAVGAKGTETMVVGSSGLVTYGTKQSNNFSFASASTAQTVYSIIAYAGTIKAVYVCSDAATQAAGYTVNAGSAGDVLASVTATSGSAGTVSTMTLGTVTVTAGQSISCTRAACGTTGAAIVSIVYDRTA